MFLKTFKNKAADSIFEILTNKHPENANFVYHWALSKERQKDTLFNRLYLKAYSLIALILGFDMGFIVFASLYLGAKYSIPFRKVLRGAKWFWIYRFINAFHFWKRLFIPKKAWY